MLELLNFFKSLYGRKVEDLIERIDKAGNYETNCLDVILINMGSAVVTVNGFPLPAAGGSLGFSSNTGEIRTTILNIQFPVAGTRELYLIRKKYK